MKKSWLARSPSNPGRLRSLPFVKVCQVLYEICKAPISATFSFLVTFQSNWNTFHPSDFTTATSYDKFTRGYTHVHTHMYIYIYFPNLYSNVVPVKLNLPPETPGVKPRNAFDPRLQPLPRLGRDPEPLIDVHIGIQWQSASMEVESVEDLVADHRSEGRVRCIRGSTVPGPRPGCHHSQWDAWNRRAIFSTVPPTKNVATNIFRFFFFYQSCSSMIRSRRSRCRDDDACESKKNSFDERLYWIYVRGLARDSFEQNSFGMKDRWGEVSYFSVTFLLKTLSSTVRICWNRLNTVWKKSSGSISTCRRQQKKEFKGDKCIDTRLECKEEAAHLGHFSGQQTLIVETRPHVKSSPQRVQLQQRLRPRLLV